MTAMVRGGEKTAAAHKIAVIHASSLASLGARVMQH